MPVTGRFPTYITDRQFVSFLTIISLGLDNTTNRNCPNNIKTATHNIISLGTLTKFPIDSATTLQESLDNFRQQIRHFIKYSVESLLTMKSSDLIPVLRISLASNFSVWKIIRDPCIAPCPNLVGLYLHRPSISKTYLKLCFLNVLS